MVESTARRFWVLSFVVSLCACSDIKGQQVTMEDLEQTAVRVHQSRLTDKEKQEFDEIRTRADSGDYDVTNKTIGQLINDQAAYDADQKTQAEKQARLAAEARTRHNAQVTALRNALTVALVDKGYRAADYSNFEYQSYVTLRLALRNNARKSIRAVKGALDFETPLGDSIYQTEFEDADSIPAGRSELWTGSVKYNQFNDALTRFRDADLRNVRLNWQPKEILFTDGSRLQVTD
jgi:hypothetical protein